MSSFDGRASCRSSCSFIQSPRIVCCLSLRIVCGAGNKADLTARKRSLLAKNLLAYSAGLAFRRVHMVVKWRFNAMSSGYPLPFQSVSKMQGWYTASGAVGDPTSLPDSNTTPIPLTVCCAPVALHFPRPSFISPRYLRRCGFTIYLTRVFLAGNFHVERYICMHPDIRPGTSGCSLSHYRG